MEKTSVASGSDLPGLLLFFFFPLPNRPVFFPLSKARGSERVNGAADQPNAAISATDNPLLSLCGPHKGPFLLLFENTYVYCLSFFIKIQYRRDRRDSIMDPYISPHSS